jgi:hypothetical protein
MRGLAPESVFASRVDTQSIFVDRVLLMLVFFPVLSIGKLPVKKNKWKITYILLYFNNLLLSLYQNKNNSRKAQLSQLPCSLIFYKYERTL